MNMKREEIVFFLFCVFLVTSSLTNWRHSMQSPNFRYIVQIDGDIEFVLFVLSVCDGILSGVIFT